MKLGTVEVKHYRNVLSIDVREVRCTLGAGDFKQALGIMLTCSKQGLPKIAMVFDTDVDIWDDQAVLSARAYRYVPDRDTVRLDGLNTMTVDPKSTTLGISSKIGLDCTVPLGPEWNPNEFVRSTVTDLGDPPTGLEIMTTSGWRPPVAASPPARRMVVGITGASGTVYGIRVLEMLRVLKIESHLVISKAGDQARTLETDLSAAQLRALADTVYAPGDIAAAISSGSFQTMGMIVAPCSVRTLSEIATGVTSSLVARAADVCLKERRRVVLMFRETPLHAGHIKSMLAVTEMGAIVAVPVPAFYARPRSVDEIVTHSVSRALDLFGLDTKAFPRWTGPSGLPKRRSGK